MKVVVVGRDLGAGQRFVAAFARAGCDAVFAAGGLYALTLLERERCDLLLVRDDLEDLSLDDVIEILVEDDALQRMQVALLSDAPPRFVPGRVQVLPFATPAGTAVRAVLHRRLGTARPTRSDAAPMAQAIKGTLDMLGLLELLQALNASGKTGVLHLDCPDTYSAAIVVDRGRIVHAASGVLEGRTALQHAEALSRRHPSTRFVFSATSAEAAGRITSIDTSTERLLLDLALHQDAAAPSARPPS